MIELVDTMGKDNAYRTLFTDKSANQSPPVTPLALVRQKVSNEFVAFQVSQGGFKVLRHSAATQTGQFHCAIFGKGQQLRALR